METVALAIRYPIVSSQPVTLTIGTSNAKFGSSCVLLGADVVKLGEVKGLSLGRGRDIRGKVLSISSVVTDVVTAASEVTVQYTLKGGEREQSFALRTRVLDGGEAAKFVVEVVFTNGDEDQDGDHRPEQEGTAVKTKKVYVKPTLKKMVRG